MNLRDYDIILTAAAMASEANCTVRILFTAERGYHLTWDEGPEDPRCLARVTPGGKVL